MRFLAAVVLTFAAAMAQASTITIDFEHPYSYIDDGVISTQGFIIAGSQYTLYAAGNLNYASVQPGDNGTNVFAPDFPEGPLAFSIERDDGVAFALYDFDLDAVISEFGPPVFSAVTAGGQTIDSGSIPLGTGAWQNIVSASITYPFGFPDYPGLGYGELDNIVVGAAVPIPAAVWLFGSALGLLGWARKAR